MIKFVSDWWQVGCFLRVLRFPPPIKLTTNIAKILLKVTLSTLQPTYININKVCLPAATDSTDEPILAAFSTNTFFFRNGIKLNGRSIASDNTPVPIDTATSTLGRSRQESENERALSG